MKRLIEILQKFIRLGSCPKQHSCKDGGSSFFVPALVEKLKTLNSVQIIDGRALKEECGEKR